MTGRPNITTALICDGCYEVETWHDQRCDTSTVTRLSDGARSVWVSQKGGDLDLLYEAISEHSNEADWIPA